ncbi:MAG: F0F1 ATP synthase subunit B, partial [Coprobacillus sp.]
KFLWIPVQAYFAKRADFIEKQINDAAISNEQAKQLMQESEEQARASVKEYRDIVEKAKIDAQKVHDEMIAEAKAKANAKLEQAQREIEAEKMSAKQEMREEMIDVAIEVATKIMNKEMNTKENQQLVEQFVDKVVS